MVKMFTLLGDTPERAAEEAKDVMRIETALAQGSMGRVEMRDPASRYHIMTVEQVQALTPDFDWHVYLGGLGMSAGEDDECRFAGVSEDGGRRRLRMSRCPR